MSWLQRITWGFAGATLAIYLLMVLWSLPLIATAAGGLLPFDLRPLGYDLDEARAFLAALGPDGQAFYLGTQGRLDQVFPPLFGITLGLTFWQIFPHSWALAFIVLALVEGWFDLQENIAVTDLLRLGPAGIDEEVTSIAALLTMIKSGLPTVVLTALIAGLARHLWPQRPA